MSSQAGLEEELLPGSGLRHRGAGTAPRPTPASAAIRATGNEPRWGTGHRASPMRVAGEQPGEGDGDGSRATPLLPTGARYEPCEPAPSPRALLGSATSAFEGGRGQSQITTLPPTGALPATRLRASPAPPAPRAPQPSAAPSPKPRPDALPQASPATPGPPPHVTGGPGCRAPSSTGGSDMT